MSPGKMALIPCRRRKEKKKSNLLCEELETEILLRLPSKAAVRFQLVCKRWYSLISSPYFIARFIHLRHHNHNVQSSSLVYEMTSICDGNCKAGRDGCPVLHSDFKIISNNPKPLLRNPDLDVDEPVFSLSSPPFIDLDRLDLIGSSADLILCSYCTNYYVSNLLTRKWVALPNVDRWAHPYVDYHHVGLLCVPPHKFMVLRLRITCSQFYIQVFSSEDCQWRYFVDSSPPPLKTDLGVPYFVAYRGMLHWLNADCILVFDPLNTPETCSRVINLPIQLPSVPSFERTCHLGVCQNRLRLVKITGENTTEDENALVKVWELEDYDSGLWNLVHKVYLENHIFNMLPIREARFLSSFLVISLHPSNEDIVYLRVRNGVVSFNMKNKIVECYYPVKKNVEYDSVYTSFHVSNPLWPTSISSSLLH